MIDQDHKSLPHISPESPFVWPEPRVLEHLAQYHDNPPYIPLINKATSIYGVMKSISLPGIELLESWLSGEQAPTVKFVIIVYPACETREVHLTQLLNMVERYDNKFSLRILPAESVFCDSVNIACVHSKLTGETHISFGNTNIFSTIPSVSSEETRINFIFQSDPVLLQSYNNHFNWLWSQAKDITHPGVTKIPILVLPKGSEEGSQMWQNYQSSFLEAEELVREGDSDDREKVEVDPETGVVTITDEQGEKIATATEELEMPELDSLAERIARLYSKGLVVSVDKLSRMPPLDAPLDPEIFGDRAKIERGAISRRVNMRVSVIDEKTLKELEKYRKSIRPLINSFSYGLAENMRWMPKSAETLFTSELDRVNKEGQQLIGALFDGSIESFIEGKKGILTEDVKNILGELGNPKEVSESQINKMMGSLKARLEKALAGDFIPKLSYSEIVFNVSEQPHIDPWGQAFTILYNIAIFSRKAISDQYFLNGIKISPDSYINAMNVFADAILQEELTFDTRSMAKKQLNILKQIKEADITSRNRCEMTIKILEGAASEEIAEELKILIKGKDEDVKETH